MNNPYIEVRERQSGKTHKVFLNGGAEGFEDGALIINHILPFTNYLEGIAHPSSEHHQATSQDGL